MKMW